MDFSKKLKAIELRKNRLYEGTCVIKIHNKDLYSRILGWIDEVKNTFSDLNIDKE